MPTEFNTWTIVFLLASAQGFFIAFVLWRWKRGNRQGNRLLAALVALFSLSMVEYVLYWTNHLYQWPHFANLSVNFPFLYGILLWLYLRTIYEDKPLKKQDLWQLVPFLLASVPFIPWYFTDASMKQRVLDNKVQFGWYLPLMKFQYWTRMVHIVCYALWNARYVVLQPKVGYTARWARTLVACHIIFVLAYISYFVLIQFPFFNLLWDYHISAVMTATIYIIAYTGYVQPVVFEGLKWTESNAQTKYRNSGLTPEASRSLLQNLDLLMTQEQVFTDPEINLEKLANLLGASKHHVSQVINENLNISFFEYINQLRVEKARELLAETTRYDLHVIEVAYIVGFNNKMSFNSAFKKATGMTPTEFRKNHGTSDESDAQPMEAQ